MLKKFLILVRSRKETFVLVAISFVLMICAIIVGISDNIPGIILSYLATTVLAIALIHTWQEVKKFLILLGASFVGFFAFAFLHNAFYGLVMMTSHIPVLSHLLEFLHVLFFCVVVFVCPIGFVVGAVGSVTLCVSRRKTSASQNV